jgi:hypothetical protein
MKKALILVIVVMVLAGGGYAISRLIAPPVSAPVTVSSPTTSRQIEPNMVTGMESPIATQQRSRVESNSQTGQLDTGAHMREQLQSSLTAELERQKSQPPKSEPKRMQPVGVQ